MPQNAILDGSARCCDIGRRDACGVCGGFAKVVDVQNVCCDSGVLDAGGYCCGSGELDECGVCNGDSQTCLLASNVVIQVFHLFRAHDCPFRSIAVMADLLPTTSFMIENFAEFQGMLCTDLLFPSIPLHPVKNSLPAAYAFLLHLLADILRYLHLHL